MGANAMTNQQRDLYVTECKRKFHEFMSDHKYLMRHVRKYKTIKINDHTFHIPEKIIGTVVVFYDDGLRVGFSKVHEGDRYNRHVGIVKAINDAYGETSRNIPRTLQRVITDMVHFAESDKGRHILDPEFGNVDHNEHGGEG